MQRNTHKNITGQNQNQVFYNCIYINGNVYKMHETNRGWSKLKLHKQNTQVNKHIVLKL